MTSAEKAKLYAVAAGLGVKDPAWLEKLIKFESGLNPAARNRLSGARGLIQFTNKTARGMGYASADDLYEKNKSFISQMDLVRRYLAPYAPFETEQALYMSVFYPVARNWPVYTQFPDNVKLLNPGIVTVADYLGKVQGRGNVAKLSGAVIILGLIGYAAYFFITHNKGDTSLWVKENGQAEQAPEKAMIPRKVRQAFQV